MLKRRQTTGQSGRRWNALGTALALIIFVVAAAVLVRSLHGLDADKIAAAISDAHAGDIALAALFAGASCLTLTLYDYFALRTIGRHDIGYPTAALAGFTSYAIGHNIGATPLTCAVVRHHVYSSQGLTVTDVAKISFITGLTFWLGNICILALSVAFNPQAASAINHLPSGANRSIALAALLVIGGYALWVALKRRVIGWERINIALPGGCSTLLQISIGIIDIGCCAAAMYVLMPSDPPLDFVSFTVVFIAALLLGYASHAPGGIGAFDATILLALTQFPREDLIARLILFRLVCYLAPGIVALSLLAVRQVWLTLTYKSG